MALLVYMTAADPAEAERIAVELVERRLAAGVNILAPMRSVYRWKGEVRKAGEIPLVAQSENASLPWPRACVNSTVTKPPASSLCPLPREPRTFLTGSPPARHD